MGPVRRCSAILLLALAHLSACGPIPTGTDASTPGGGRVYENEAWGFSVTVPDDSTWSWNARTLYQIREPNGLPRVEVEMRKSALSGSSYRPQLVITPTALPGDMALADYAAFVEEEFRASRPTYVEKDRLPMTVEGAEGVAWTFDSSTSRGFLRKYLVAVVVHDREVYVMVGTGISSYFPRDEFLEIASSLRFSR